MPDPDLRDQPLMSEVVGELLDFAEERLPTPEMRAQVLAMAAAEAALRAGMSREWLLDRVAFAYDEGERPLEPDS
jgi:RimJ/RimL family protein N-acetyltransferase